MFVFEENVLPFHDIVNVCVASRLKRHHNNIAHAFM